MLYSKKHTAVVHLAVGFSRLRRTSDFVVMMGPPS
jgi:hypothetical protein